MAETTVTYEEALDWLHGLLRFGQNPGLERMQWMLGELGHPERTLTFIHVAGTNGKGSTCAYLTTTLMEAGYSVGTFTSPYITDFRERIRYNDQMIPREDLSQLVSEIRPLVERCAEESGVGSPTEFEVITLLAILYFVRTRPSVVVWETGLGGRLDSTNVVFPLVSVITNVGLDHTDVLGDTIAQIAAEKAGIIKSGTPVVIGEMTEEARSVIEQAAKATRSTIYQYGRDFTATPQGSAGPEGQSFTYRSVFRRHDAAYDVGMLGAHQIVNASVAMMVLDVLREFYAYFYEEEELARGMRKTRWLGRLEVVNQKPLVILDGAHNTEGMEALVKSLPSLVAGHSRVHLFVAALGDKPLSRMASVWQKAEIDIPNIYLTSFDFPRAASADTLFDAFCASGVDSNRLTKVEDWSSFVREWISKEENQDDVLIICGSLYFIAQVRAVFPIHLHEAGE
ncbi:bifunctional folylpolyglutamate synthase/dihydrofolate synthase [Brevibacillus dissolubilis]|uniref:bifunctional folylpolyglutamate synthase/dihydrofolate synthase n=1 Tax=Brevibacillus dissolubilis TaxID=1844116 RepID=UPI001115D9C3|nr:folylpolyglutamate synthase/dihydrofolate synthase family protein [Brevibacillus dissolubilis]